MKLKTEFNPLVIVGAWNKHIFNPEWINKYLLPNKKLEVEFPLNIDGSPRISTDTLRIYVLNNKLNIMLRKANDSVLEEIEELALKIADYLPHTPVIAFGINFLFESDNNYDQLKELLKLPDTDKLTQNGFIINSNQIRHNLFFDDKNINLSIIHEKETYKFDFNFHFEITSLVEFKNKLNENSIVAIKNLSIKILNEIYNVE